MLRRDGDPAGLVAASKPGPLNQPRRRHFDAMVRRLESRNRFAGGCLEVGVNVWCDTWIEKERADTAGVGVRVVQDHSLSSTYGKDRFADVAEAWSRRPALLEMADYIRV